MPYEPFLIADLRMGVDLNREPWISPPAAWKMMENAYVFRGRIWKRQGYGLFGELGYEVTGEARGHGGLKVFSGTLTNFPVCRCVDPTNWLTEYSVKLDDGGVYSGAWALHDGGDGILYCTVIAIGTIDYETGDYSVDLGALPAVGGGGLAASYEYLDIDVGGSPSENAVLGFESRFPRSGGEELFAWDRRKIWKYNTTTLRFEMIDQCGAGIGGGTAVLTYTSGMANFIWAENFFQVDPSANDALLFVNGIDPCYYWDGSAIGGGSGPLKELNTSWVAGGTPAVPGGNGATGGYNREVDSALMCFRFKNRCVLLSTIESGTPYPQRARWSQTDPDFTAGTSWNAEDWRDCPTADWIISATFFGEDLVVFFESSVWKLEWRDDFHLPFEWVHLFDTDGSLAQMSTIDFTNEIITLSRSSLVSTDTIDIDNATPQVPDIILGWNPEAFQYSFGVVVEEGRQALFSYVPSGETYPTKVLSLQYEDDAVANFDFPFHCYGYYQFEASLVWDSYPDDWDTYYFAWDERTFQAGFPAVLAGDRNCRVFTLWSELGDWNADPEIGELPVYFKLLSNRLNPYSKDGRGCRLGVLSIYASTNADVTLKVSFFGDFKTSAYKVVNVNLSGTGEKVRKQIPVFVDKAFHQVMIEEASNKLLRIDALEFTAMPTAALRQI